MIPSVGPSSSWRRRHRRTIRARPLRDSSTTGAPSVAEMYSPVVLPRSGCVMKRKPAVLITVASRAAIPAPQANANTRLIRGSGSSRSASSTSATSSGTGSKANGSAMKNGATLCRTSTLCSRSAPSRIMPQPIATTVPVINPARGRPGVRPSMIALGSKSGMTMARERTRRTPQRPGAQPAVNNVNNRWRTRRPTGVGGDIEHTGDKVVPATECSPPRGSARAWRGALIPR